MPEGDYEYVSRGEGVNWHWFYACNDCGAVVGHKTKEHDRFHAIANEQARVLAILVTSHVNERTHSRWDVYEKAKANANRNNWSAEAFAEVVAALEGDAEVATDLRSALEST